MKIEKSWLKDYVSKELPNSRLVEIFTLAGLEIDNLHSSIDQNIIIGKIVKIEKHPNADKLQIAQVNDGTEIHQIVCGAKNIAEGQIVPLALPGSKLFSGEIKSTEIRGIRSDGMLCSQSELGIGEDHSGIFILPADYILGKPLADYIQSDTVFDLDITPNRGDCLSHIGVAREIAAFENLSVKKEPISLTKTTSTHCSEKISINIENKELCPQYLARVITGVKIGPSPKWLQDRLIACGAKPINNVVDVTNYILLDLGHPMHAFDWNKISGAKITVRNAKKNEDIVTLDGEIRNLTPEILVIADEEKAIAVAGIMGGKNSEVDAMTETVVLEAAQFDQRSIRKSAKNLKLSTEASYRFERGIDSGSIEYAINKAAELITKISGGKIMQGIVQSGNKAEKISIEIPYNKIASLLGIEISEERINQILKLLGFVIVGNQATVPSWRHDVKIWQDLAEEIGRVIGYDKIKPISIENTKKAKKTEYYLIETVKDKLVDAGFSETINYPFLSESDILAAKLNSKNLLEVANPMQPENKYLRNSLIPGLLKNIAKNPTFDQILLFEIGHIYKKSNEQINLAIAISGKLAESISESVEEILRQLNLIDFSVRNNYNRDNLLVYKIKKPSAILFEINLTQAFSNKKVDQSLSLKTSKETKTYRGVSKYPAITRDLAFITDKKIKASEISKEIYLVSEMINRVELFDEFSSDKFGAGKKNLAFHIYLQSMSRTLKDSEANEIIENIIKTINKKFSAKLRD